MNRVEKALENHKKGYNCSQAVACAFCDKTSFCEADLFRIMEGFGLGGGDNTSCPWDGMELNGVWVFPS